MRSLVALAALASAVAQSSLQPPPTFAGQPPAQPEQPFLLPPGPAGAASLATVVPTWGTRQPLALAATPAALWRSGTEATEVALAARELAAADASLRLEATQSAEEVRGILQELRSARATLARQRQSTRTLEQEVLRQREVAVACQHDAQQLEGPKSEQVRRAELLRLRSASANTQAVEARIAQTEQEVAAFRRSGESQLAAMRGSLGRMQQQASAAEMELKSEAAGRESVLQEVSAAAAQVRVLRAKLAANGMASLVTNNTQLKSDLQQAQRALEMSEANIARAGLSLARAHDAATVLRRSAEADETQAQKIARESLAEVMQVRKEDTALTARTEAAAREAQSVALDSCDDIWDREHPEVMEKLQKCEQTKLDLQTATAELASMSSIMSASGARAAAGGA